MYVNAKNRALAQSAAWNAWPGAANAVGAWRYGTAKNEIFWAASADRMAGGRGDDTYSLWFDNTTVLEKGGEGIDTVNVNFWGSYTLTANVENLFLVCAGAIGGTGNALDNIIAAGTAGATLNGRGGDDVLVGGSGADTFVVKAGEGSDAIENFAPGWDIIKLQGYGITGWSQIASLAHQTGDDLTFHFANGESLVVRDTTLGDLTPTDFGLPSIPPPAAGGSIVLSGPTKSGTAHGWTVVNNVWNPGPLVYGTDYTIKSSYTVADMTANTIFSWTFPAASAGSNIIRAYPEVTFGDSPYRSHDNHNDGGLFPVQVGKLRELIADYSVDFGGNIAGFNVAYDIWFTDVPGGKKKDVSNEIMVWVHKGGVVPFGTLLGTYTDGDFSAQVYHKGTYTAFVTDQDMPSGKLNIMGLIDYLKGHGYMTDSEYLASVELGSEIVSGSGWLSIENLDLKMKAIGHGGSMIIGDITGSGATVSTVATEAFGYVMGTEPLYDLAGTFDGKTVTDLDTGGAVRIRHYAADGALTGTDLITQNTAGAEVTKHYDAGGTLLGSEITSVKGGVESVLSYMASGSLAGSTTERTDASDRTVLAKYSASGALIGTDITSTNAAGVTITQHFNASWGVTGADKQWTDAKGVTTITHAAASGVVTRQEVFGTIGADQLSYTAKAATEFHGGAGADTILCGAGADRVVLDATLGSGNVDRIKGYSAVADTIVLDHAVFDRVAIGTLSSAAFVAGTAAADANDRVIYDKGTGIMLFDADGKGAGLAVMIAQVDAGTTLTNADFVVI
ncbi:GH12 family glycosyl hydrolase domain-containing protein [Sphingomonas sp. ID0503]|uniref:GH12 family glycosyl hydrolase domain-containing protein n=1 Tax=Sphingomonas sp. ID0503 TaxID=3399691 RepID=UPI003AFB135D